MVGTGDEVEGRGWDDDVVTVHGAGHLATVETVADDVHGRSAGVGDADLMVLDERI